MKEYLKVVQEIYKLSDDDAGQIEKQVLEPHQKYQESLRLYEGNYTKIISDGKIPEQQKHKVLKDLQQLLNLRDEDVKPIHDRLISPANNPPETPPTPPQTDNLSSEKGIDYTTLRDLLAAQKWQEADKETYEVMIKAVSKKSGDWLTSDELLNFPCKDLRTIDQLWVKYSKGKFGFSVQKEIYLSVGGKADGKYYSDAWGKFVEKVGWKDEVTYDASPHGHLPFDIIYLKVVGHLPFDIIYLSLINLKSRSLLSSLASRLVNCNI
ncbi:GUN4 domain-containing protein [Trichormus sp. NMC-1]|uniref:GUN4 domain-containing protein n=1 Tax=Trichormus sp. NMC-1 TaxID=1853259 RepID=UPI0008DC141C|nr:GUN4 domain-containing protein [Trichormus sp. NMC-1]